MAQSAIDLFKAGSSLVSGVLTIDFNDPGRSGDGISDPSAMTPAQAADVILKHLSSLTTANDDPTAAITGAATQAQSQYIATRGGTAVTQMRKAYTIYSYFHATDTTGDPDNLI